MGEYADDAIFSGIDESWGWRRTRPILRSKTCKWCGKTGLSWHKDRRFWILVEEGYIVLPNGERAKDYKRHNCKLKDSFKRKI